MATIYSLLGIICIIAFGIGNMPCGSVLGKCSSSAFGSKLTFRHHAFHTHLVSNTVSVREKVLLIASSQIGVREATGNNDGVSVRSYLKVTNLPEGNPYCAAFVSWIYFKAGHRQPRTAWSPSLFPLKRLVEHPQPADVLGIYSIKLKRIAHCGLVERIQKDWVISIEGNTNLEGGREGDGVYRKWRHKRTIAKFSNWLKKIDRQGNNL